MHCLPNLQNYYSC